MRFALITTITSPSMPDTLNTMRLRTQTSSGSGAIAFIKDQLELETWLIIGALLQCTIMFLPFSKLARSLPATALLIWKVADTALKAFHLKRNPRAVLVQPGKMTASFEGDEQYDGLVVFILGVQITQCAFAGRMLLPLTAGQSTWSTGTG
jgi:hypothetical protein